MPDNEIEYEWAVHTVAGLSNWGSDEAGARQAAEEVGGDLLRRPAAWESVQFFGGDEESDDED